MKQSGSSFYFRKLLFLILFSWRIMLLSSAEAQSGPTNIQISSSVLQSSVSRLGINLSDQSFYDSGQMLKNLIFKNPGFEGEKYRSIMVCYAVTANSCTDDNEWSPQPTGFWTGATYTVLSGKSAGMTGRIVASTQNPNYCSGCGQIIQFDKNVNAGRGDYFVMTQNFPGNGDQGWWDGVAGGGTVTTESSDISPESPGKQAIVLNAFGAGQSASVTQYFDNEDGLSFIQLNGAFAITFRAKDIGGNKQLALNVARLGSSGTVVYLNTTINLTSSWQDYTIPFTANENGSATGTAQLSFTVSNGSVELDDVSLAQTNSDPANTTAFRDDVVTALKQLHPGTIRMMAGIALGSDLPNQLQVPFARYRVGWSTGATEQDDIPYGIHEFLELCQAVGADPWITIPTATSPAEMQEFIEYLTGTGSDAWSALRIARGQAAPWTSVFGKIHIELGNETWNGSFRGESMDWSGYPQWANQVFGAARQSPGFVAGKFDLVIDGCEVAGYDIGLLAVSTQHDSIDFAPYLLYGSNDEPMSTMFGALFAEPEMWANSGGMAATVMQAAQSAPTKTRLNIYETNLSPITGNSTEAELNSLTPSIGAGIGHAVNMLEMMRLGVAYQNAFALPQYAFLRNDGLKVRLWGMVVDMGTTNRRRPQFLTEAMANAAIGGNMLQTTQSGANPTWNQPLSSDSVQLGNAHDIQSFAFQNGNHLSAIVFNLSQTAALPVTFSGALAPTGQVQMTQITSGNLTDNNETAQVVAPTTQMLSSFSAAAGLTLPRFSMTVLTWTVTTTPSTTPKPVFSIPAGTYTSAQTVAISDTTTGAAIYYTTDGSTPGTGSTAYAGPIRITATETVKAIAVAPGTGVSPVASASYTITPPTATPVLSLASGTYSSVQSVTITDATAGATIYYTMDGSTPGTGSAAYAEPIPINSTKTLKAAAIASNHTLSTVVSASYIITLPTATPVFSVAAGKYSSAQTVSIEDATAGATIYYTINGSTPTNGSTVYSHAITVSSTETIRAIAVASGYAPSSVASATYTINLPTATPVFSVASGTYASAQTVSITDATAEAKIYYTTDGTTPTTGSRAYNGPVLVGSSEMVKAVAIAPEYSISSVASANYTIDTGETPIALGGGFSGSNLILLGYSSLQGSALQLTSGQEGQQSATWYPSKVMISSFTSDFDFQLPSSTADGFTFTIENSPQGYWTMGSNGDGLGYAGISNSVAVAFDLYSVAGATQTVGVYTNGVTPTGNSVDMAGSGINLHNGHIFHAHLAYAGTTLTVTVTDSATGASFTHAFSINMASTVGATSAYVGFTGSTGAFTSVQHILDWTFKN